MSGLCLYLLWSFFTQTGTTVRLKWNSGRTSTICQSFVEFGVEAACKNVPRKHEFRESRCSESRTVSTGVN